MYIPHLCWYLSPHSASLGVAEQRDEVSVQVSSMVEQTEHILRTRCAAGQVLNLVITSTMLPDVLQVGSGTCSC